MTWLWNISNPKSSTMAGLLSLLLPLLVATAQAQSNKHVKLFVFGDSYADTGNTIYGAVSWRPPYGITFPGTPTGRFSDGRVLTDYIASYLGIESPIPYRRSIRSEVKGGRKEEMENGVNYAHGGTGVFHAMAEPNMTTQIDYFQQQMIEAKKLTQHDLDSSIALVCLAGNDYAAYIYSNHNPQDLKGYARSVVKQLSTNLRRIHALGVHKIAVTALEPIGCVPQMAALFSYQSCDQSSNSAAIFHNQLLTQSVLKLNTKTNNPTVVILDLYQAFMSKLQAHQKQSDVLRPCCEGVSRGYFCGSVDEGSKENKYVVCNKPELSLFWDTIHPSQSGWHAVFLALQPSLRQLHA